MKPIFFYGTLRDRTLLELVPEMAIIAPVSGALVGYFALAKRQGWGVIVAIANGLWTAILTIGFAWLIFLAVALFNHVMHGLVADFENFLRILGAETEPLAEGWVDLRLFGIMLGASAVAAVFSEIMHWVLVRLRRARGDGEGSEETA